jgi:hypothetical protein
VRISQQDIIVAVDLLLRSRGHIAPKEFVTFRFKFGIVGDPEMTIVGDAPPDAGQVYIECSWEPLPNIVPITEGRKGE